MCGTFCVGSTLQAGWLFTEYSQIGFVLDQKFNWNSDGRDTGGKAPLFNNLVILIIIALAGMGLGSNYSPNVINKYGHFNTFIGCNFLTALSKLL